MGFLAYTRNDKTLMIGKLILEDGTVVEGRSFGSEKATPGEVVFTTGMVGYPESLTDPSYAGQILVFTYPLIGNYGVPDKQFWESDSIKAAGVIVSTYNEKPSHFMSKMTLAQWLKKENIPALEIKDTRLLAKKLRTQGTMLGKIVFGNNIAFQDPNKENLVAKVSAKEPYDVQSATYEVAERKTVVLYDCGVKRNIIRSLVARGLRVTVVPWNYDILEHKLSFDAVVISNGPGDPKIASETIIIVKKLLERDVPILGICLGNQILALATGGDTYKLKFGHRSQNQPCLLQHSSRCYLTTQNHGFAVGEIPPGFKPWFVNANDNTNEGLIHAKRPVMSVQFHPEATPGPEDTEWVFDYFIEKAKLSV